jgi:Carboxypeptidase regulatory-like domain/Novel STAND NTPase 1
LSVFPEVAAPGAGNRAKAAEVVDALVSARLLTAYEEAGEMAGRQQIEIAHESLLQAWPRLVRWQTQDADGEQLRHHLIPGVAVVTRNQVGLSVTAVTDADGAYHFPSLPPGTYELTTSLTGFVPAAVTGIDLRLGRELTIDLVLQPAGPEESVVVSIESPLIAVTQSARTTSVRDAEIEKMPKGRDFTSLATQAAGANDEPKLGGLSVDGSSGAENRFLIDGMESTDLIDGRSGQRLATDFVEELQVKSSGYSAEHGGSTGAVLNVVTKSGGNVWHGDALVYWSDDALDAGPRPTLRLNPIEPALAEYGHGPPFFIERHHRRQPVVSAAVSGTPHPRSHRHA